eukprot:365087-Chlamydomonas_euryale.AAC.4
MVGQKEDLLPPAVLRQIGDKLYEKRKVAALEVEQVRSSASAKPRIPAGSCMRVRMHDSCICAQACLHSGVD